MVGQFSFCSTRAHHGAWPQNDVQSAVLAVAGAAWGRLARWPGNAALALGGALMPGAR